MIKLAILLLGVIALARADSVSEEKHKQEDGYPPYPGFGRGGHPAYGSPFPFYYPVAPFGYPHPGVPYYGGHYGNYGFPHLGFTGFVKPGTTGGSHVFVGEYKGSCKGLPNGLYYVDKSRFCYCSYNVATVQECAEGSENPKLSDFYKGTYKYAHDFCSVNLLAGEPADTRSHEY